MRKTKRTSAEMFPLVEQYLQGGQSPQACCAEHGLSACQLDYWRRKYRAKPKGEAFLEVGSPTACERAVMEAIHPRGCVCVCLISFRCLHRFLALCCRETGHQHDYVRSVVPLILCRAPTDMRESFNGFTGLVRLGCTGIGCQEMSLSS